MRAALLGLASAATSAGFAMACPFGSSAEFEAAMIARRREAAARLRKRRQGYALAAATAVLLVFVLLG
jgi:DNA invertase Pin-like site-specific DNA recombinase